MGFNKPIPIQYLTWFGNLLRGEFGKSIHQELQVRDIIFSKMGATIQLAIGGWVFAILVGVPLGVAAASTRGTVWDYLSRGFALFGQALPQFWTGIMAILIFAVLLQWLPAGDTGRRARLRHQVLHTAVRRPWLACSRRDNAPDTLRDARSARLRVRQVGARKGSRRLPGHLEARTQERTDTTAYFGAAAHGRLSERRSGRGDSVFHGPVSDGSRLIGQSMTMTFLYCRERSLLSYCSTCSSPSWLIFCTR